eukprot:scaffold6072_cov17-Tisochrysis_lutea.AAC.3
MHVPAQSCVAQVPDQPKHASNTTQQLQRALFMARKFRHMAAQWQQAGGGKRQQKKLRKVGAQR